MLVPELGEQLVCMCFKLILIYGTTTLLQGNRSIANNDTYVLRAFEVRCTSCSVGLCSSYPLGQQQHQKYASLAALTSNWCMKLRKCACGCHILPSSLTLQHAAPMGWLWAIDLATLETVGAHLYRYRASDRCWCKHLTFVDAVKQYGRRLCCCRV